MLMTLHMSSWGADEGILIVLTHKKVLNTFRCEILESGGNLIRSFHTLGLFGFLPRRISKFCNQSKEPLKYLSQDSNGSHSLCEAQPPFKSLELWIIHYLIKAAENTHCASSSAGVNQYKSSVSHLKPSKSTRRHFTDISAVQICLFYRAKILAKWNVSTECKARDEVLCCGF